MTSREGVGSTFSFWIKTVRTGPPSSHGPPRRASIDDLDSNEDRRNDMQPLIEGTNTLAETTLPTIPETPPLDPKDIHVLIVEDNLVNQKVLAKQLRSRKYVVSVADHGAEALTYLETTELWRGNAGGAPLSIVLLDLEMPIMGGLECVRRVRELEAAGQLRGHTPVIAVTANARLEQKKEALAAGMVRTFPSILALSLFVCASD